MPSPNSSPGSGDGPAHRPGGRVQLAQLRLPAETGALVEDAVGDLEALGERRRVVRQLGEHLGTQRGHRVRAPAGRGRRRTASGEWPAPRSEQRPQPRGRASRSRSARVAQSPGELPQRPPCPPGRDAVDAGARGRVAAPPRTWVPRPRAEAVGEHLGGPRRGDRRRHPLLRRQHGGYRGWRWAVTAGLRGRRPPVTVSEVVLLPGAGRAGRAGLGALARAGAARRPRRRRPAAHPARRRPRSCPATSPRTTPRSRSVAREVGLGRPTGAVPRAAATTPPSAGTTATHGPGSDMARSAPAHCGTCGFFLPLAGVAARRRSASAATSTRPRDGAVVAVEFGCGAHSDVAVEPVSPVAVAELVYDDGARRWSPAGDRVDGRRARRPVRHRGAAGRRARRLGRLAHPVPRGRERRGGPAARRLRGPLVRRARAERGRRRARPRACRAAADRRRWTASCASANTGAPLDAAGVAALASLRASAKRDDAGSVGRFGVGFAAVLALSDAPRVVIVHGGVAFSAAATADGRRASCPARPPSWPAATASCRCCGWCGRRARTSRRRRTATPPRSACRCARTSTRTRCSPRRRAGASGPAARPARPRRDHGRRRATSEPGAGSDGVRSSRSTGRAAARRWLLVRGTADGAGGHRHRAAWPAVTGRSAGPCRSTADGRPAPLDDDVLHAPTTTAERLGLPARLIADVPLDPDRRRVRAARPPTRVLQAAAGAYLDLVRGRRARRPAGARAGAGFPRSELDARLRALLLDVLRGAAWLPGAAGADVAPRTATGPRPARRRSCRRCSPTSCPACSPRFPRRPCVAKATFRRTRSQRGLPDSPARGGCSPSWACTGMGPAELADRLLGVGAAAGWWRALYAALEPAVDTVPGLRDELRALPVPLADGRTVPGPARRAAPAGRRRRSVGGPRAARPARRRPRRRAPAAARLGAALAEPDALLDHPALRDAVDRSVDDADAGLDPVPLAEAVLGLVAELGPGAAASARLAGGARAHRRRRRAGPRRRADAARRRAAPAARRRRPARGARHRVAGAGVAAGAASRSACSTGSRSSRRDAAQRPDHGLDDVDRWLDEHRPDAGRRRPRPRPGPRRRLARRPRPARRRAGDPRRRARARLVHGVVAGPARPPARPPPRLLAPAVGDRASGALYDPLPRDRRRRRRARRRRGARRARRRRHRDAADLLARLADPDRAPGRRARRRRPRRARRRGRRRPGRPRGPRPARAGPGAGRLRRRRRRRRGPRRPGARRRPPAGEVVVGGDPRALADLLDLPTASEIVDGEVVGDAAGPCRWAALPEVVVTCHTLGVPVPAGELWCHDGCGIVLRRPAPGRSPRADLAGRRTVAATPTTRCAPCSRCSTPAERGTAWCCVGTEWLRGTRSRDPPASRRRRTRPAGVPAVGAHLAAGAAGHGRRGRDERLRRADRAADGRAAASRSRSSPGRRRRSTRRWWSWRRACSCATSSPGPFEGLGKHDLPSQLCAFTAGVLRAEARHEPGCYDVVHSHYWLSGQVGWLARDRWGVPLVHTAHTLARVKNAALADGDPPEPMVRVIGEDQVVAEADRLVAQHRRSRPASWSTSTAPTRRGSSRSRPAWTSPGSARATGPPPGRALAIAAGRRRARLRRPDPAAEGPGRAAARGRRAAASATRRCARGWWCSWRAGRRAAAWPSRPALQQLAAALGLDDVVRFLPPQAADGARDGLPGGRRRRGAEPQRVVRAGRAGGAGVRDAGGRRARSAGCRSRWRTGGPGCSSTGTGRSRGRTRWRRSRWIRPGGRRWRAGRWRTRSAVLLGPDDRRPAGHLRGGRGGVRPAAGGGAARGGVDAVSDPAEVARGGAGRARGRPRGARSGPVPGHPARHQAAADALLARGARARALRAGVRLQAAGRGPRGRLPLPAAAQRPSLRRALHARPGRRHPPRRPRPARVGDGRRDRPAAGAGPRGGGRRLQHAAGAGLRLARSAASTRGARSGASRRRTWRRSSTCWAEAVAGARECSMVALLHSHRSKATMLRTPARSATGS